MMSHELPEGWARPALKDGLVIDVQPGFACGTNNRAGTGVAHLRPMNVNQDGTIDLSDVKYIPSEKAHNDRRWLQKGDVLFNNTNSTELVGKTAVYSCVKHRAFSNHMTRIRCRSDVLDPYFCATVIHQNWREGYFEQVCNQHVSQSSVSRAVLLETTIPLPPLAEQKRIVAKVEELLARVNAARERLARVPLILKRFRQSVLAAACSGRLTADWREERGFVEPVTDHNEFVGRWKRIPLKELCRNFQYGTSKKSAASGKVPVLRMGNLQDGEIDWSELVYSSDQEEIEKYSLPPLTVLFNRTNSPELVGKTSIYRGEQPAIFAGYLIRIHHGPDLDPEYLNYSLNAPDFREYRSQVKTDGVSQSNINAQKLAAYEIPWCPFDEQQEIVRRVEALFRLADAIEKRTALAQQRVEKLTQAILAKAFRGELVPTEAELARQQGRDYEPASDLLERIRKERQNYERKNTGERKNRKSAKGN